MHPLTPNDLQKIITTQPSDFWRFFLLFITCISLAFGLLLISGSLEMTIDARECCNYFKRTNLGPFQGNFWLDVLLFIFISAATILFIYFIFNIIDNSSKTDRLEDVLTPLRQALVGRWKLEPTYSRRQNGQMESVALGSQNVEFLIEPLLKKLCLKVVWPHFISSDKNNFHGHEEIIYGLGIIIFSETPSIYMYHAFHDRNNPNSPRKIFAIFNLHRGTDVKTISELSGPWYDLNSQNETYEHRVRLTRI